MGVLLVEIKGELVIPVDTLSHIGQFLGARDNTLDGISKGCRAAVADALRSDIGHADFKAKRRKELFDNL